MKDLESKEEAVKHLQHIKNTLVNLDEPTTIYKTDYRFEIKYLNNTILLIDTRTLDIKIDDLLGGNDENNNI